LILRAKIQFVDFAFIKQAARAIAAVIGVARDLIAESENGDAAALVNGAIPPIGAAARDQLVEFDADDALVCCCQASSWLRQRASDALARRISIRTVLMWEYEQASPRPSSPTCNKPLAMWITGRQNPCARDTEDEKNRHNPDV
jgi:hypothetical protein